MRCTMAFDASRALLLYYHLNPQARGLCERLASALGSIFPIQSTAPDAAETLPMPAPSVVITVGGDGTILRAARLAAPLGVPLLGVNMGRLGFLTEVEATDAERLVPRYLCDEDFAWTERRQMVKAVVSGPAKPQPFEFHALNEVVVGHGPASRLSRVHVRIDGVHLTTYAADSVIVASATGSTAYSLSAGGPILPPESTDMVLTAVAPHGDLSSSVVVPSASAVELEAESQGPTIVAIDGFVDRVLESGDRVAVSQSPYRADFLRTGPRTNFYETLVYRLRRGSDQALSIARMIADQDERARG
jgi:NAD+ kinase